MIKKIAHCIHHTHWDLIWYFTAQDAAVQFSYNMKEMIKGFREKRIENFFMDGQTAPIDEYLILHPEDKVYVSELVKNQKLVVGPFNSQLDSFISSGESVINNLRLGIKTASELGKVSYIAYLPDSFGHSYDYPKIFNQFRITSFVITRGVGDNYGLGSEFYMQSNDGSRILVYTMIAGYGYGCYAFEKGDLFEETACDYNKIRVNNLIERLIRYSTVKNEFVFPLGFDQNPAILDISKRIEYYNNLQKEIEFKSTSWFDFFERVKEKGENIKIHKHELFSTQYHRVHKSIFSARADIKRLQDRCERILTYELQPIMTVLDALGVEYNHGIVDEAWRRLVSCQTHSSANLTDETNNYIERETKNVLNLSLAEKTFLIKLVSISLGETKNGYYPLVIFNTLPIKRKMIMEVKIFSKKKSFVILDENKEILPYTVIEKMKKNCGVVRKDESLMDKDKYYYETDIFLETNLFEGISYKVYDVVDSSEDRYGVISDRENFIENQRYKIYQSADGVTIHDKKLNVVIDKAIFFEESGDEGDSYDYSYPDDDLIIIDYLNRAKVEYSEANQKSIMTLEGTIEVPFDLEQRKNKKCNSDLKYLISIELKKDSDILEIVGEIDNCAEQHRVRLRVRGKGANKFSWAGTQYGYIKRETNPEELKIWKKEKWFEEPSPTFPLLNHVSLVKEDFCVTVFTKSSKEYEVVDSEYTDLAITLFRSYGALGYPDLNRRPGRPSGIDYMIFLTPEAQLKKKNSFELGICYESVFNGNKVTNSYIQYACEDSYYQQQNFNKTINPISYFPTNPSEKKFPRTYKFIELKDFEGSFGTVVKSDKSEGYILRVYNNENYEISGGQILGYGLTKKKQIINLLEETKSKISKNRMPELGAGTLRMIKIEKEDEY